MAEVSVEIGGRSFEVACQEGEEHYLNAAAALLDGEAKTILAHIGRLPENRMLLMAGLMLADKTAGISDELEQAKAALAETQARLRKLEQAPKPEAERIEVPVIPEIVKDSFAEIAARAESLADQVEERAAG